jgi:hypothetical protein
MQYTKATSSKTCDMGKILSDADKDFRKYIDRQVDSLILLRGPSM